MSSEFLHALLIAVVYLSLLGGGEVFYRLRGSRSATGTNLRPETMRKLIHSAAGLMSLAFPFLLDSHWTLLALISGFVILLIAGQKFNFTTAINATKRDSIGDILFPIGVYLVFLLAFHNGARTLLPVYVSSILILSVSDSAAAIIGTRWGKHRYSVGGQHKSWEGSLTFAITAFLIIAITLSLSQTWPLSLVASIIIVIVLTFLEAVSLRGTDNITVPVTAFFMISFASGNHSFNRTAIVALFGIGAVTFASSRIGVRQRPQATEETYSSESLIN